MLNTCISSRFSLRTNGSFSFSTNDYAYCSNERHPFAYSSSRPSCCCCCCCSNPMYRVPFTPNYCYGIRQSSLIQWSPYRRVSLGGFDRSCYARLRGCDVDVCGKDCNFRGKGRVGRKGVLRKCLVFEERGEMCDDDLEGYDEAEVVLSLFGEDVGEDCYRVRRESKRLVKKKLVVETRENGEVGGKCSSSKVGRYDLDVSESERSRRRREEMLRREDEREEALVREEEGEERKHALLTDRARREKDEREALLRKAKRKAEEKQELRKENWKVSSRTEDREDLLRREEKLRKEKQEKERMLRKENWKVSSRTEDKEELLRREKLRKDGSGCSSYYSVTSTGDIDSDDEVEHREGRVSGNSSSGQKRNSASSKIVYHETRKDDRRREDYREDYGARLTKKSSSNEGFSIGSSSIVAESDHRKKSEKKLVDISVEEMDSKKETSVKELNISVVRDSNNEKLADYLDDRKVIKSSGSIKFDDERKQQLIRTGDEVSSQSETRTKYKQFAEMQDRQSDDVRTSYGSQQVYSGKSEVSAGKSDISAKDTSSSHETVGLRNREEQYQRNAQALKIQEIDIERTSIAQHRFETSVKREEDSTNIRSSINEASKQKQQYDRVSGQVGSSGKSQQLIREDGKSILKRGSDKRMKQEERKAELTYGSYLESQEQHSKTDTKSGNSGGVHVEDTNKTKSETPVRSPSNDFAEGSSRLDTTAFQERKKILDKSHAFDHGEAYNRAESDSKFNSHEDAIGSAALLEKTSAHYVTEFVDQVRSEISGSEIRNENLVQSSSGDQSTDAKGPSDEMWKVDESSVKNPSKPETQENTSGASNVIVKRSGRSLWNVFADIVRLRWTRPSESHSSGRRTGGKNSPNQSTTSEAWFSGHEEGSEEKEGRSVTQSLSGRHHEEKIGSEFEEGSSSTTSDDRLKNVGTNSPLSPTNLPSSSVVPKSDLPSTSISLPSGGEISEGSFDHTSSTAGPLIRLPELRLRRSPHVSDSGISEQQEVGVKEGDSKKKKLQRKDQLVRDQFDEWEEAYRIEAEQRKIDEMFMRQALEEAKKAADNWEVPVGAVLVHDGKIIARGCNLVEELRDSTAHAEMICIREASSTLRTWRLSGTTLYVTLEPCAMCAGAILQARIDTVVWGAPNKLLGADGSWIRLFPSGDGGNALEQTDKPPAPVHPFHPKIIIRRGVLASECADAMQQFFKLRRKKDKKTDPSPSPPSCLPISHRPSKFLAKMHDAFTLMFCL